MTISSNSDTTIDTYFTNPHMDLSLREIILLSVDKLSSIPQNAIEGEVYRLVKDLGTSIPSMYIGHTTSVSFSKNIVSGVVKKLIKQGIIERKFDSMTKSFSLNLTERGKGETDFLIHKLASSDINYLVLKSI